jgi:hypothetical protein
MDTVHGARNGLVVVIDCQVELDAPALQGGEMRDDARFVWSILVIEEALPP